MYIYDKNTTEFNNNGYGILTDSIVANVTEMLNDEYSLLIEYPVKGNLAEYLLEENIIKAEVGNGNLQLFRIKQVEKTLTRINVYALHIFYDLLDNYILESTSTEVNCQTVLSNLLTSTESPNSFEAFSDISITASQNIEMLNPVEAILGDKDNSIINLYGGELKRDNFRVGILSRLGSDNGVKISLSKNINSINISTVSTSIVTRAIPVGYNKLLLPESFVDSPRINEYPEPKYIKLDYADIKVDPENEDAYGTLEEAYAEMRRRVGLIFSEYHMDQPVINIKVDWVELSQVEGYKERYSNIEKVELGDTVLVELYGNTYNTRCIKRIYNVLLKRAEFFEIGTLKPNLLRSTNKEIAVVKRRIEELPSSILTTAKDEATALITSAMGGYIHKTQSELYIMDTDEVETASHVWRWNINGLGYSSTGINGPYGIAITNDGQIVADFITAGTLNVSKVGGLQDILSGLASSISLNGNNIQFAIDSLNSMNTNGVGKLQNTLVTINDEGVNISKSGQEMKSLLSNTGLTVTRDSEVVLSANNVGVEALNVNVKKYLVIGNKSRMEDFGEGTGVFFIG